MICSITLEGYWVIIYRVYFLVAIYSLFVLYYTRQSAQLIFSVNVEFVVGIVLLVTSSYLGNCSIVKSN